VSGTLRLFERPRAERIRRVEQVRARFLDYAESQGREVEPDRPLSQPSETWRERMSSALVSEISQSSFDELVQAFRSYVATLPGGEGPELRRRVAEFAGTRNAILEAEAKFL
jgi:hypothetical protein